MKDFRKLEVWQEAHEMTLSVFRDTKSFPVQETYGLTSQLRRSSASVPANIAEGCGCNGKREFCRFLGIALRSASETEYHLLLARDLEYMQDEVYKRLNEKVTRIKRMLTRLLQRLGEDETE